MAYIGKTPTPSPLTASDIADGIISSAKIADGTIATADIADSAVTKAKTSGVTSDMFRNLVINGDMSVHQRNTSATSNNSFGVDRFVYNDSNNFGQRAFTFNQDTDVPSGQGLTKSMKVTMTTPETAIASSEYARVMHRIEAQNLQHLKFGTSNAQSLTLSFFLKTNVTGNFGVALFEDDDSRIIGTTYTQASSGTWERITVTFAGDTTVVIDNVNGSGLRVMFLLSAGGDYTSSDNTSWGTYSNAKLAYGQTANLLGTSGGYWSVTGVQLEVGTSASDFEFLPHDVNLKRCERYFYQAGTNINGAGEQTIAIGQWYSSSEVVFNMYAPTTMRTKPTLTTPSVSNGYRFHRAGSYQDVSTAGSINDAGNQILSVYKSGLSGGTGGQATFVNTKGSPAKVQFSAEL